MLCNIPIKSSGETHRKKRKRRTRFACVVDADESRSHQCERDEFYDSLQSCSQVRSDASSNESSRRKIMGTTGENPGMAADECQKQEGSDR